MGEGIDAALGFTGCSFLTICGSQGLFRVMLMQIPIRIQRFLNNAPADPTMGLSVWPGLFCIQSQWLWKAKWLLGKC